MIASSPRGSSGPGGGYFSDPALRQRLDLLQHLAEYADLLLLVKGEAGVGKTALLEQLLKRARDNWRVCRIDATPLTTTHQLLVLLGAQLGLEGDQGSADDLRERIAQRLRNLQAGGQIALLVVDDAHVLAEPVLEAILQLYGLRGPNGKLLRVLLLAEPQIERSLSSPRLSAMRRQVTHTLDVPPLSEDQAAAYVAHRLGVDDGVSPAPDASELHRIFQASGGLPGRINPLLDPVAAEPAPPAEQSLPARRMLRIGPVKLAAIVTVVVVLVAILVFQRAINTLFAPAPAHKVITAEQPGQIALALPKPASPSAPTTDTHPPVAVAPSPAVPPPSDSAAAAPPEPTAPPAHPQPAPAAAPAQVAPAVSPPSVPEVQSSAVANPPAPPVSPSAAAPPAPSAPSPPQPLSPAPPAPPTAAPAVPPPAPRQAMPAAKPRTAAKSAAIRGREWLLAQSPAKYTLQLMGGRDSESLKRFVRRHHLEGKVAVYRTRYRGGPWYVLLYGIYPNHDAAVVARKDLSKAVRGASPWPRSLSSVQAQIRG